MEEEEDRRQQIAMEVRVKREKSEEILKERENVVRKVFMPAYDQLYTYQVIVVIWHVQARETALESARVRGQIKDYYMRK